ncbi:hypothetical protein SCUCBS95973_008660 [Sporothrix curviconia]|uniref:ribonuclease T1 n=1 Tax=Sporothrix curviconia TaxID=1260050 RepID=A0ABP0CNT2_9PEZI
MAAQHTIYYSPSVSEATHKATFTRKQINAAIGEALNLLKEGKQIGEAKYPHAYKKYPTESHAQEPIFEFPILLDGSLYKGTHSPGPDRVVFGSVTTDYASADYVGVAGEGPDGAGAGAGAPSTPGGPYTPHIFRDTSVNRGTHLHGHDDQEDDHDHDHDHNVTPVLTPPEGRDLIADSDVKVHFSD